MTPKFVSFLIYRIIYINHVIYMFSESNFPYPFALKIFLGYLLHFSIRHISIF